MEGLHQGLFIAKYDFGLGNEWVTYLKEQTITVYAVCALLIIMVWIISMAVAGQKDEEPKIFTKLGYLILAELVIASLFGYTMWQVYFAGIFTIFSIISGIGFCIIGINIDAKIEEEEERHRRFRRQRMIRKYQRERGRRR